MTKEFFTELNLLVAKEAKRYQTEQLQETDWTLERAMEEHGLTINQARKLLNNMAAAGHFEKIRIASGGGAAKVAYRPVEKKDAKKAS